MKLRHWVLATLAASGLVAGCSSVIDGSGSAARSGGPGVSTSPDFPSQTPSATDSGPVAGSSSIAPPTSSSGAVPLTDYACPDVQTSLERLAFTCLTATMTSRVGGRPWNVLESTTVEAATSWSLDMGMTYVGQRGSATLESLALKVRTEMVTEGSYGTAPTVRTDDTKPTTIDGKPAHLVQTTFTLNPTFRKTRGTAVQIEKSWILAIEVAPGEVTLWYTSIPDLRSVLWAKVPGTIAGIRVL